jgi:hypothetical protein
MAGRLLGVVVAAAYVGMMNRSTRDPLFREQLQAEYLDCVVQAAVTSTRHA